MQHLSDSHDFHSDRHPIGRGAGAGQSHLCLRLRILVRGTGNAFLETATTGTCGGTKTQISNTWFGVLGTIKPAGNVIYRGMTTGDLQLCVNTSAAVTFSITVYYAVQ
jgi:hypothetical protein